MLLFSVISALTISTEATSMEAIVRETDESILV